MDMQAKSAKSNIADIHSHIYTALYCFYKGSKASTQEGGGGHVKRRMYMACMDKPYSRRCSCVDKDKIFATVVTAEVAFVATAFAANNVVYVKVVAVYWLVGVCRTSANLLFLG